MANAHDSTLRLFCFVDMVYGYTRQHPTADGPNQRLAKVNPWDNSKTSRWYINKEADRNPIRSLDPLEGQRPIGLTITQ